jgi:hypothetical protein
MKPSGITRISLAFAFSSLLAMAACSGSLFKVKPPATLTAMPASAPSINVGSLSFQAAPLVTDEESQELFESNLQLAGLMPIRIEIRHNGGDSVELKKTRFGLHDASGTQWKLLSAKQAISRILSANKVFTYNPHSRRTFEKEFRSYELDLKNPLSHSERRRSGFIFFQSPKKEAVASPQGLILSIEGLSQPASLSFP